MMLSAGFAFNDACEKVEQAVQVVLIDGGYYADGYQFVFRLEDKWIIEERSYRVRVALKNYQPFDISISEDSQYCYLRVYPVRFARVPLPVYPEEIAYMIHDCTGAKESGYDVSAFADTYVLLYDNDERKKVLDKIPEILERVNTFMDGSVQLRFESWEGQLHILVCHKW